MLNPAKIYTVDTGLLGALTFRNSTDNGPLLENLVFLHLRRKGYDLEYVQPKAGGEIDFFARDKSSGKVQLIQVCWDMSKEKTFARELKGLHNGMQELNITEGIIVTWDEETEIAGNISLIPAWKWLLS